MSKLRTMKCNSCGFESEYALTSSTGMCHPCSELHGLQPADPKPDPTRVPPDRRALAQQDFQQWAQQAYQRAFTKQLGQFGGTLSQPNPVFAQSLGQYQNVQLNVKPAFPTYQCNLCGTMLPPGSIHFCDGSNASEPQPEIVHGEASITCTACARPIMPGQPFFGKAWEPTCTKCHSNNEVKEEAKAICADNHATPNAVYEVKDGFCVKCGAKLLDMQPETEKEAA